MPLPTLPWSSHFVLIKGVLNKVKLNQTVKLTTREEKVKGTTTFSSIS